MNRKQPAYEHPISLFIFASSHFIPSIVIVIYFHPEKEARKKIKNNEINTLMQIILLVLIRYLFLSINALNQ